MINRLHLSRLIAPIIAAVSIITLVTSSSPTLAMSSMDTMGHSNMDVVSCINLHQVAPPTATSEVDQLENEDDDDAPQELPYYLNLSTNYAQPNKQRADLISSSSFRPPDIVILTLNLRI